MWRSTTHPKQAAEAVLAEVRARGADGFAVAADVTKEEDLRGIQPGASGVWRTKRSGQQRAPRLSEFNHRCGNGLGRRQHFSWLYKPRLRCCGTVRSVPGRTSLKNTLHDPVANTRATGRVPLCFG